LTISLTTKQKEEGLKIMEEEFTDQKIETRIFPEKNPRTLLKVLSESIQEDSLSQEH